MTDKPEWADPVRYADDVVVVAGEPMRAFTMMPWQAESIYDEFRVEIDRAALARDIDSLGEAARAKMAARLARETALDRDQACGLAAALHHLGKGVDWFVRMIPAAGTQTAARCVMTFVRHEREDLAMIRARERAALMEVMLGVMIDMNDVCVEISPALTSGELTGLPNKPFAEPLANLPPYQPAYMRHDPTKQHKRRKRR